MRCSAVLLYLICTLSSAHSTWQPYPDDLPQFDYSGLKLQQNWEILSVGTRLPWPNAQFIEKMMGEFPQLSQQLIQIAKQTDSHPALKPILQQDYQALASELQQVWRFHFQGQYQHAYELGMQLGPAGLLPAIYSKLVHTTFLIENNNEKQQQFLAVDRLTQALIPLAPDYNFLLFGDAYQKARRLELMSTTEATASGLLGPTQDVLKSLHQEYPNNQLYSAMLAGIDAGIIERVGSFLGGMTYGADEDKAIQLFNQALRQENRLAVLYHEYAQVLIRLDDSDHDEKLHQILSACIALPVFSAEEALNQQGCKTLFIKRLPDNG